MSNTLRNSQLKIVSDGTVAGTKFFQDGKAITGVSRVEILPIVGGRQDRPVTAVLTFVDVALEMEVQAEEVKQT